MTKRLVLAWLLLASCKDAAPAQVLAGDAKLDGVEVKTRRSTVKDGKLAWGGLVTNTSDRLVRGADVAVVVRKNGGTAIGQGHAHVDLLPAHYGVRLEVNAIAVDGTPALVDVVLEKVDLAPPEEKPFEWKPASVGWKKPLPDGLAFAVFEDEKCAGVMGKKGEPVTLRCVVGVKNTGTRAARDLSLGFEPARGGDTISVKPPFPTDLPIEPGDALVYFVNAKMKTPSETLLEGTAR